MKKRLEQELINYLYFKRDLGLEAVDIAKDIIKIIEEDKLRDEIR